MRGLDLVVNLDNVVDDIFCPPDERRTLLFFVCGRSCSKPKPLTELFRSAVKLCTSEIEQLFTADVNLSGPLPGSILGKVELSQTLLVEHAS